MRDWWKKNGFAFLAGWVVHDLLVRTVLPLFPSIEIDTGVLKLTGFAVATVFLVWTAAYVLWRVWRSRWR